MAWEIAVDDVYFDGTKLERSVLSPSSITLSALIDTVSLEIHVQLFHVNIDF